MAADGEIVLLAAAKPILSCAYVAASAHGLLAVNVPKTVEDHRIKELAVSHPVAFAGFGQEVRRGVMLSMPPAITIWRRRCESPGRRASRL